VGLPDGVYNAVFYNEGFTFTPIFFHVTGAPITFTVGGHSSSTAISLGGSECRMVSGVAGGAIRLGADFYSKPLLVTLDANASASGYIYGTSMSTTGLTIGSTANRVLVAQVTFEDPSDITGLTVTWNSVGMTQIGGIDANGGTSQAYLYGLVNPDSGNHTLAASWTNNAAATINGTSFYNAKQTGGATTFYGIQTTGSSGSSPLSVTVSSFVGDMVIGVCQGEYSATTPTTNKTKLYGEYRGYADGAGAYCVGAASVTMTFTAGGATLYAVAACGIRAAGR
jgi:hypothetical protein